MPSAKRVIQLLRRRKKTLSVAESCTGGYLAKVLTDVPGASRVFKGGIIAYADEIKRRILGVPRPTLSKKGAVSRETALRMAASARRIFRTDYCLSLTGIAGPGGAGRRKPVGLVWIAAASSRQQEAFRFLFRGGRAKNRSLAVRQALQVLEDEILGRIRNRA